MSTDNRTIINDCEANTGWAGDDTANAISTSGSFVQGSGALSTQLSNSDEGMWTTQDSVGAGTYSLDWSDSTLYLMVKDNLTDSKSNGGMHFIVGDGTDTIGYFVGGNDAVGMPYKFFFNVYKLDVSVVVASPGVIDTDFHAHAGTEANLDHTVCTQIGYGSLHLAKAVGSIDNVIMDCFRYIANGSYALSVTGGTSGTPETMADVAADDITSGWGMVANPLGTQYIFCAPTEWGEITASAAHHFEASGEQWFWMGDNAGGLAVGAGNFPFRVVGNATDVGSFVINSVAIVNTGTPADFDCSNTDIDTLEIDGCSMAGLASFSSPSTGGTSRFCTDTILSGCGAITHNGADMSGCSILETTVAANASSLIYNETADPDSVTAGMSFTMKVGTLTHAIELGLSSPLSMTLTDIDFSGYNATNGQNDSVLHVKRTTGTVNITISGGSGTVSYRTDGATVNIISGAVTVKATAATKEGAAVQNARVLLKAADGTGAFPFEDVVTITRSGTTATVTHTAHGMDTNDYVLLRDADQEDYNIVAQLTYIDANSYSIQVANSPTTPATGTITATFVALYGLTNVDGEISTSRVYTTVQPLTGYSRKSTSSPYYTEGTMSGDVSTTLGFNKTGVMVLDE